MDSWLLLLCCVMLAQWLYLSGLCKRAVDLVPVSEDGQRTQASGCGVLISAGFI